MSEVENKIEANEKVLGAPVQIFKLMGFEAGVEPPKEMGAELLQLMAQEQSRWTAFNAQLEALEKALTPIAPRR